MKLACNTFFPSKIGRRGQVAKAGLCKSPIVGSNPTDASMPG